LRRWETASSVAHPVDHDPLGRAADRIGNLKVMYATSVLVPLIPLLWLVSTNLVYLIVVQVFSGLAGPVLTCARLTIFMTQPAPGTDQVSCLFQLR